ncbi:MAG: FAD-binding oxidoreductase [Acidimicrobiales bacterium]
MAQHGTGPRVVVIGGGIAGVSAAYALARHPSAPAVTLIEAEGQLAQHTTGRSAAQLIENYGTPPLRALTKASLPYFLHPPEGLADGPLLERRGVLTVADDSRSEEFERQLADGMAVNPTISEIPVAEAVALFPALRPEPISRALWEPESYAIDVAAVHQSFVRGLRSAGGTIATHHRAVRIERAGSTWLIRTGPGGAAAPDPLPGDSAGTVLEADVVVNAAGAWGDDVARRAGLIPIGLQPLRRTAFMVASRFEGSGSWPLVADIEHRWYVKPDGVQFLCSPAEETPSVPCDARPEEVDVAQAIDAINEATTIGIRAVASSWTGLRTFTPDRTMAIGPDPAEPSFVWCVGQGGTGIQSSPGAGQLVADLALDGRPGSALTPAVLGGLTLDPAAFSPARFLTPGAAGREPAPAPHPG